MGLKNDEIAETWEIRGKFYIVMHQHMPGLWLVVERDNPAAEPILRDRKWIETGKLVDPAD